MERLHVQLRNEKKSNNNLIYNTGSEAENIEQVLSILI